MLPWTPDEYLHRVLPRNKTTLPAEALDVVRFWSLKTWYEQDNYGELCMPHDADTTKWISILGRVTCVSENAVETIAVDDELPYYLQLANKCPSEHSNGVGSSRELYMRQHVIFEAMGPKFYTIHARHNSGKSDAELRDP